MLKLQPDSSTEARDAIDLARKDSIDRFEAFSNGKSPSRNRVREEQDALLQPAGVEDFEDVARDRLQGVLSQIIGSEEVRQLSDRMAVIEDWDGMTRIRELRDPNTCHDWLRSISPQYGNTLSGPEFTDAIRGRLGVPFVDEGEQCQRCGKPLDSRLIHAQCCARPQSTK